MRLSDEDFETLKIELASLLARFPSDGAFLLAVYKKHMSVQPRETTAHLVYKMSVMADVCSFIMQEEIEGTIELSGQWVGRVRQKFDPSEFE